MKKEAIEARLKIYKTRLDLYYKAEAAILEGAQSYYIGSRHLTRADLAEIRKIIPQLEEGIEELEAMLAGGGRRKCIRIIPRDV